MTAAFANTRSTWPLPKSLSSVTRVLVSMVGHRGKYMVTWSCDSRHLPGR